MLSIYTTPTTRSYIRTQRTRPERTYTLPELKAKHPATYNRLYQEHRESQEEIFWASEIMDSLKATIKHANARLYNWNIGPDDYSVKIDLDNDIANLSGTRAHAWLENNFMAPLRNKWTPTRTRHSQKNKYNARPGYINSCPFTGCCYDEDFIDALVKNIRSGMTVKDSLKDLARTASKLMEQELDYQLSEENFIESNYDNRYTKTGRQVN